MNGQGLFGLWWTVAAPPAAAQAASGVDASSLVGTAQADMLVTAQGLSLYVFTPDTPSQIACTGICARFWPALRAAPGTSPLVGLLNINGLFGVTLRPDGGQQLTYDGAPLYTFIRDAQPGDMKGQGVLSTWWVAVVPS
jgi:predicted lipoprotein with Yx(FWY)xxD motif